MPLPHHCNRLIIWVAPIMLLCFLAVYMAVTPGEAAFAADETPTAPPKEGIENLEPEPTPQPTRDLNLDQLPVNNERLGMIYDGLRVALEGQCAGGFQIEGTDLCTHGPDLPPPGVDVQADTPPLILTEADMENAQVTCDGNGTSGNRVQVIYARASDRPNRYNQYAASIRQWAAGVDQIYYSSAVAVGDSRRVRWVHDNNCNIVVDNVVLSPRGDDTFSNTIDELRAQGYNRTNRKYMIFVDANVYCGIGNIWDDDRANQSNRNNSGPSYGRNDRGCWDASTPAHELNHNLGGVQLSAPNSSGGWHCVDEWDLMCYSDEPYRPTMRYDCPNPAFDNRLDCNNDDYYHPNPPSGSYLATHWNTADSKFLLRQTAPPPPPPGCEVIASTKVPRDINENVVTWSNVIVDQDITLDDVNLTNLYIYHTYDADLRAELRSPTGTIVQLFNRVGGSGDNFLNTKFDDSASRSINSGSAPFTGTYRPQQPLSAFNGENARGVWRLKIEDVAGGDSGTLESWSLELCGDDSPPPPPPGTGLIYASSLKNARVAGLRMADEDVIKYNQETGEWDMHFDGSDVGLKRADISDFKTRVNGNILMSFEKPVNIPGLGLVDDSDIVKFIPSSLGSNTRGSFDLYLDGSAYDLTTSSERIDAVTFTRDNELVISTIGSYKVNGTSLRGGDEDLLKLNANGRWELYFDGSDASLTAGAEDVNGAHIVYDTGDIYLTTKGNFNVGSVRGDGDDILVCSPTSLGTTTNCNFRVYANLSDLGFPRGKLDGISINLDGAASNDVPVINAAADMADDPDVVQFDVLAEGMDEIDPEVDTELDEFDQAEVDEATLDRNLYLPFVVR